MSGLPPTGPNNKVSTRSKTSSIKRPISMDVSEHKKEGKGLFSKIKKGSSNSKLNEESQYRENSPKIVNFSHDNNTKNNQNNITERIQGRNFESDEEYELCTEDTVVTKMEKLFNNNQKVIKNPALVGSLLKYLTTHNLDYYSLLYYLIVQHYKMTMQNKELAKEATRFINEIYTTFLHEKSVLRIEHNNLKSIAMEELKALKDLATVFDESASCIFNHCITNSINKVKTSIAHGLFTVESSVEVMSFDEKMSYFNNVIKYIVKGLEGKLPRETNQNATKESKEQEQYQSDVNSGVKSSLATIYFYFSKKDRDENSDNLSTVSSKFNSIIGKSLESTPVMTNCLLEKQPMFCSKIHKRPISHSFIFKKGKVLKGHNFQEKIFDYPAICLSCDKLLWGIAPQGFLCSHCQGASHKSCKDFVKITCQKDLRKYQRNSSNLSPQVEGDTNKNSIVEENVTNSAIVSDNTELKDIQDKEDINVSERKSSSVENEHISENAMEMSISFISSDISPNVKSNYVKSTATIIITNDDEKSPENTYDTEFTDSISKMYPFEKQIDLVKSEGDKPDSHHEEKSHVKTMANKYDQKSIPRSQSVNNVESNTLPRINKKSADSVHVQDLIQDTSLWHNDPDMEVEETFEAGKELKSFPEHLNKEQNKAEYTRLLVLMEFHHKTKFTVMTLKRFDYLLIKSWPRDETLFFTLSLNCIRPLYGLIKILVDTIESCRSKSTFSSDTAEKVLEWLVSNDETNLQEWLKYSIDLCCTNSLTLVKNTWKDALKNDLFLKILDKRYNKILMVEQLSNMKPLLFNFPLIIDKLIRDLSKFPKFKEETKIWKMIFEKFKLLPAFIDKHCMPLVQQINQGVIINSLDRSGWIGKINNTDPFYNFIIDFPKTAFHYKLFDFQEVKISNLRESRKVKVPPVYVKETIDAIAICYENILVLLQKENDKYLLKQFKSTESTKFTPILTVDNVHTSKGEKKNGFYELNMVFINAAVLTQLLFCKKEVMDRWHDFIYAKRKTKTMKSNESSANNNNGNTNDPETLDVESTDSLLKNQYQEIVTKFDNVKEPVEEYLSCLNSLKLDPDSETYIFPTPNDSYEFLIGTTYDVGNIFKLCHESIKQSLLNSVRDEIFDQLLISISVIQNRIEFCKNSREKDTVSINDNDNVILERDEPLIQSLEASQLEFINYNESEEPDEIPFHSMDNPVQSSIDIEVKDSDFQQECQFHENITLFVDEYVDKIIAAAQLEINQFYENTNNSDDHLSSQDNLFVDQISQFSN